MYTNGVRKLFFSRNARTLEMAQVQALDAGYEALVWNGRVYIYSDYTLDNISSDKTWHLTPLTLEDFSTTI